MQFIGSSADQEKVVKEAVVAATNYITDGHHYLVSPPAQSTGERYTTWFGADDPDRKAYVQKVLTCLSNNDLATFTYDCTTRTDPNMIAFVRPDEFGIIHLGPLFWTAPDTGADSKAGILVREASKFLNNGGTREHEYWQEDCKELARSMPENAGGSAPRARLTDGGPGNSGAQAGTATPLRGCRTVPPTRGPRTAPAAPPSSPPQRPPTRITAG